MSGPSREGVEHWRYLFSIAYRMLGSVHEAEDVVQEAYVRWTTTETEDVDNPRAYLATVVTRLAIDRLRSAAAKRETYVGPWLPEPLLVDPAGDPAEAADPDSLSFAFLLVLDALEPVERAVFLLREVFGYPHAEIAAIVQRSETNVRQIASRARRTIEARRPHFDTSVDERRRLGSAFVEALHDSDIDRMIEMLAPDVTCRSDGGGIVHAARKPLHGPERVAAFLLGVARVVREPLEVADATINGGPGALVRVGGEVAAAISFEVRDDRIAEIFIVANPDKLEAVREETR